MIRRSFFFKWTKISSIRAQNLLKNTNKVPKKSWSEGHSPSTDKKSAQSERKIFYKNTVDVPKKSINFIALSYSIYCSFKLKLLTIIYYCSLFIVSSYFNCCSFIVKLLYISFITIYLISFFFYLYIYDAYYLFLSTLFLFLYIKVTHLFIVVIYFIFRSFIITMLMI